MLIQVKHLTDAIMQAQDAYEKAQERAAAHHRAYRDAFMKRDDETAQKHAQAIKQADYSALREAHRIEILKELSENGSFLSPLSEGEKPMTTQL